MEFSKLNLPPIHTQCPKHPSQIIQMVDPTLKANKQFYCSECILETRNPKLLSSSLVSLEKFVNNSANLYKANKQKHEVFTEQPYEYLELLSRKAEALECVSKYVNKEKKKVNEVFDELLKVINRAINVKREHFLKTLEKQVKHLESHYNKFEKEVKRNFPTPDDMSYLFPSLEELENRLDRADSASQLVDFIEGIKEDAENFKEGFNVKDEDEKNEYLAKLANEIRDMENIELEVQVRDFEIYNIKDNFKRWLDEHVDYYVMIKEHKPESSPKVSTDNSPKVNNSPINKSTPAPQPRNEPFNIIEHIDINKIKEWLPLKYRFLQNTLLYKCTKETFSAEEFHRTCDEKGPTITLIRCQFEGSSKTSIIGGFMDKCWHSKKKYIESKEAFIFSLTKNVKCSINKKHVKHAAYGHGSCGPVFGAKIGNDLCVHGDRSFVFPCCYVKSEEIVESEIYPGVGCIDLTVKDIEIYRLN